jgi:anti-sigma B factor antagonist
MTCRVTSRTVSGVAVIDLSGRLDFLEVSLREEVQKMLEQGSREFVINVADVPYVDSFGLGQLITVWTSIQRAGGKMTLLWPTSQVLKLLELTRLDTVFTIWNEEHHVAGVRSQAAS